MLVTLALIAALAFPANAAPYLNASAEYASGQMGASPHQTFKSSPAQPVLFNFQRFPDATPADKGCLFIAPRGADVARKGATITEWNGELVWDGSEFGEAMSFSPATFKGEPVIALWQGDFNSAGYGNGRGLVLDRSYAVVANFTIAIQGHSEAGADFHEFQITANDTALVTSYVTESADLTAYGGPASGFIMIGYAQEVNITSGAAVWTWRSLDHVPPSDGFASPGTTGTSATNPWDYFHINSISKDETGNYLISARHTSAVYYVGADGKIIWTMGGRNSTLQMNGVSFSYQHDARFHPNPDGGRRVSLFDNAGTGWVHDANSSRGLLLAIDENAKSVSLVKESLPFNQTVSESQGNFDRVGESWIAGWGQIPVVSEHDDAGNVLWSAQFGVGDVQSYRAHRAQWAGYPTTNPSLALDTNGTSTLYASWNGATEVAKWEVLGAERDDEGDATTTVANVTKTGFETAIEVPNASHAFYQVRALDAKGASLGYSSFVAANGTQARPPTATPTSPPTASSSVASDGRDQVSSASPLAGISITILAMSATVGALGCII